MAWQAYNHLNIPEPPCWSDTGLEGWEPRVFKRPEACSMSVLPNMPVTAHVPTDRRPSQNYHLQPSPTPAVFGPLSSPSLSSASSDYLEPGPIESHANESHLVPHSVGGGAVVWSTHPYDSRCHSPWTDMTYSPVPSSICPDEKSIRGSIDEITPSAFLVRDNGAAFTPASFYDPSSNPWANDISTSAPKAESVSEATRGAAVNKRPCRSRHRTSKKW